MKPIKHIALGALITLSIFSAVLYSSCVKNECGAVTCLNKGTCSGGICKCTTGIDGVNCEIIYRNMYGATYIGLPPDDATSDTTNMLAFVPNTFDSTNYNTMDVTWTDTAGQATTLPVELTKNSTAGSDFVIPSVTLSSITYTGSGRISTGTVTMQVKRTYVGGGSNYLYFNNYIKQ